MISDQIQKALYSEKDAVLGRAAEKPRLGLADGSDDSEEDAWNEETAIWIKPPPKKKTTKNPGRVGKNLRLGPGGQERVLRGAIYTKL